MSETESQRLFLKRENALKKPPFKREIWSSLKESCNRVRRRTNIVEKVVALLGSLKWIVGACLKCVLNSAHGLMLREHFQMIFRQLSDSV